MKHASDRELLDMLAADGRAPDELAGHLDRCPECRQRLEAYSETWDILGRVREEDVPADLAAGIMQTARRENQAASRRGIVRRLWDSVGPVGRAAAVIVAASVAGFGAGRFTAPPGPSTAPAPARVTSEEAAQAVFLDELASAPLGISEALNMAMAPQQEEHEE